MEMNSFFCSPISCFFNDVPDDAFFTYFSIFKTVFSATLFIGVNIFYICTVWLFQSFIYVKRWPLQQNVASVVSFMVQRQSDYKIMRQPHSGVLQNMKYNEVEQVLLIFQGCDYLLGATSYSYQMFHNNSNSGVASLL